MGIWTAAPFAFTRSPRTNTAKAETDSTEVIAAIALYLRDHLSPRTFPFQLRAKIPFSLNPSK